MGALSGFTVLELAGMGPCPMAGMLLADMGAEVIVIDRGPIKDPMYAKDMSRRGKTSLSLNLKSTQAQKALLRLVESADVLIEGFRPGVVEKLGIGPEDCHAVNPALVYGRMTGWGQEGPLAQSAGHDINYLALTGALHAIGAAGEKPTVPLNLVGDFGGGAMFLVTGVLAALLEASRSGKGQVVDAAMVDGVSNLMWMCHSFHAVNAWDFDHRGTNILDGGAFFYDTYECADLKHIALGAIEPQFFTQFVELSGIDKTVFTIEAQRDQSRWPELKAELARAIKKKTRDQWTSIFENTDACLSPVLTAVEAIEYPHSKERDAYEKIDGYMQPAPAPRFSRTPSKVKHGIHQAGQDSPDILLSAGFKEQEIKELQASNALL